MTSRDTSIAVLALLATVVSLIAAVGLGTFATGLFVVVASVGALALVALVSKRP